MIRLINIGDQICVGDNSFAFYDTVECKFCSFNGSQVFDSVEDFKDDFTSDQNLNTSYYLDRFLSLMPDN